MKCWAALKKENVNGKKVVNKKEHRSGINTMKWKNRGGRSSLTELLEQLMTYDVISFGIFDTAIYRKVDMPNDVFSVMAMEMGHGDFVNVRKTAENVARERKEHTQGTREVSLAEIYDVMAEDYGIHKELMEREINLELELSTRNPYIYRLYLKLLENQKTILFTSDMYLPQKVIEKILEKNGYRRYEKLYLSNSLGLRKGNGTLQKVILKEYPDQKIIHIGDSLIGDVEQSRQAGLEALFHADAREIKAESQTDNMAGSIYRAVVNNCMYNGVWDKNIYYSHGFQTGGILTAGYCEYINQVAERKQIDKILFCARDCDIIRKVYNCYFKKYENEYIQISRYAAMGITLERYLYDWAERFIFRYIGPDSSKREADRTVAEVLEEAGTGYLIADLPDMGIDGNMPAGQVRRGLIKRFVFSHADRIRRHNEENVKAAVRYYKKVIGKSKRILVVDVGWSGTCITALKYFVDTRLAELSCEVSGALMCTTKSSVLKSYMERGVLSSYIYSPYHNRELLDFMISEELTEEELDYRHLALECLFTSAVGTLIQYGIEKDGSISFERAETEAENAAEILDMQEGILQFVKKYREYTYACGMDFKISPYTAFQPLLKACCNREDLCKIYARFRHDSLWLPYEKDRKGQTFGACFSK